MPLASGTRLGPYEILMPIARGGMGEVYKARDTRLGRVVALKIIREPDPEARQRFQREARAISALNHSLICRLFDVGQQDGTDYLVMEYLEGETLATRLKKGPLSIEDTLRIGAQIAEAVDALHHMNFVHRDLKPGNIMLTKSGIKLLDFGLSKTRRAPAADAAPDPAVTQTAELTHTGVVVGTVQYMAPEQLASREADVRSDLFALGAVLYEMVSGKPPFRADSHAGLIAAILEREPAALSSISAAIPERFDRLVRTCLAKDPERWWQSAGDLRYALEWIEIRDVAAPPSRRSGRWLFWLTGVCVIAAAIFAGLRSRGQGEIPVLGALTYSGQDTQPSASPDGNAIVFSSLRDGRARIWLKELARGDEFPLTAGEPDGSPRFSPDGSTVLFNRGGTLYRISTLGGAERKLVDNAGGGDWSPDGAHIVWPRNEGGKWTLYTSGVNGEEPRAIAQDARGLGKVRWSVDGRSIVASIQGVVSVVSPESILMVASDGSARKVISSPAGGFSISAPAWLGPDEILYVQALTIGAGLAVPSGSARLVRQNVRSGAWAVLMNLPQAASTVDVVGTGRVVTDAVSARQNLLELPLSTMAALAPTKPLTPGTSQDRQPVYSPDGDWILFASNRSGNSDLWKVSTRTGELRRVTDDPGHDWDPAFTPDGKHIVWSSNRSGVHEIWTADADGVGPRQITHDGFGAENPGVTRDGWIYYVSGSPSTPGVWKIRMDGTNATRVMEGICRYPDMSPDGLHLAIRCPGLQVLNTADDKAAPVLPAPSGPSRTRWSADGLSLIFSAITPGPYGGSAHGLWIQDVVPGRDTTATRRGISSVDPSFDIETWAASPDGKRIVISVREISRTIMLAGNLPNIFPRQRK